MSSAIPQEPAEPASDNPQRAFYRRAIAMLQATGVPFLVGGAYALKHFTGVVRNTKDFDLFLRPAEFPRALEALAAAGYGTEITFAHWLGKACEGEYYIDLIFNSGNGLIQVDETWFEHAPQGEVLGLPVRLTPAEEMLWSKAFILERDRYDGADIAHLLLARAERLDWTRLLDRFGAHWRLLLSHLILFGYTYPGERDRIPYGVMQELLHRLQAERGGRAPQERLCRGTLLSHSQYRIDIEAWGFHDARLVPRGNMSTQHVAQWTAAFADKGESR